MLVGAWPLTLQPDDLDGMKMFAERIIAWQEKALREAKHHSAWAAPNAAYEAACRDFVHQILDPARASHLVDEIAAFATRLSPAGAVNGLAQTLLRLTVPGVPDLFQGTEYWDLSLVDPDNRRPVDYGLRQASLAPEAPIDLDDWRTGRIKQAVIAHALALRERLPALFAEGRYLPLRVTGPAADHVVAFARQHGETRLIVAVTRLSALLLKDNPDPLPVPARWRGTRLSLPRGWSGREGLDVLGNVPIGIAPHFRWQPCSPVYPSRCW